MVTSDHVGTPLFCPDGDLNKGLINLAPLERDDERMLMPLYWEHLGQPVKESSTLPTHPEEASEDGSSTKTLSASESGRTSECASFTAANP